MADGRRDVAHGHIGGLDWLRAWGSVAVVAWHLHVFGRSPIFLRQTLGDHRFELSDFLNFHVLLVAVPLFMAVSCFLFARRPRTSKDLRSRLSRVGLLLLFWPFALRLWVGSYRDLLSSVPGDLIGLMVYAVSGAHTIYYFFASLLITTVLTFGARRLSSRAVLSLTVLSCFLVAALPPLAAHAGIWQLAAYWSPFHFVPCALASVLLARHLSALRARAVPVLAVLLASAVVSAAFEWRYFVDPVHFPGQGFALPAYTRLSVLFCAYFLLAAALFFELPVPRVIGYMSRMSLALYCLHPFMVPLADRIVDAVPLLWLVPAADLWLTIALSYGAAHGARYFLREGLLR